jgi:DNA-binding MarR family transcriptional regulator
MIRSLVRDGFLVRLNDPDDKRKVRITRTPKARKLQTKLMPFVSEVNEIAVRGIDAADQETVRRVLASIYANLSQPE